MNLEEEFLAVTRDQVSPPLTISFFQQFRFQTVCRSVDVPGVEPGDAAKAEKWGPHFKLIYLWLLLSQAFHEVNLQMRSWLSRACTLECWFP